MFDRFLSVFSLVSRIPVKVRFRFDASRIGFRQPLAGIFPAVLSLLTYTAAIRLTGMELFSTAAALPAEYLCFNRFRLDGPTDTADAFPGRFDREKRLAILKDSRTGLYGLFAGIAAPAVKFCLLCGLLKGGGGARGGGWTRLAPVVAFPIGGRLGGALVPCMSRPAKHEGRGALAGGSRARRAFAGFIAALLIWGLVLLPFVKPPSANLFSAVLCYCLAPLLAGGLSAAFYARVYTKGLGGFTGDASGAAIETGEELCLFFTVVFFAVLFKGGLS